MHQQINDKVALICKVWLRYMVVYEVCTKSQEQGPMS